MVIGIAGAGIGGGGLFERQFQRIRPGTAAPEQRSIDVEKKRL